MNKSIEKMQIFSIKARKAKGKAQNLKIFLKKCMRLFAYQKSLW